MAQKSHFQLENQNLETTLFSSTFKIEENKVGLEFWFSNYKYGFLAIIGF